MRARGEPRRVVVTGLGVVSPAGTGLDAPLPTRDAVELPGRRGAHSAG